MAHFSVELVNNSGRLLLPGWKFLLLLVIHDFSFSLVMKTCVPFTLFVRCIEDNKTFSIYSCDSSCSLDHISNIVIREVKRHYGYAYKSLHFDIYTDFDFLHTKYFKL